MVTFGDLIQSPKPVLLDFYSDWGDADESLRVLRGVVSTLGDKVKVFKIDIHKNPKLVNALSVKGNPTFMVYKGGQMQWRETGVKQSTELVKIIQKYL